MMKKTPALAKITRPRTATVLARTRLFRWLDRARRSPVVWVSGPPGAGKTTLVSSYVERRRLRCLWYQLDAGDGDVATFFHYLGLAAGQSASRRRRPLPHLTPEYLAGLPAFTRRYFEELFARLKSPAVVVLDNYHDVPADSAFHGVIAEALAAVPRGINVVILSRGDPPPALAKFRANDALSVLGWDALQLTLRETLGIARLHHSRRGAGIAPKRLHDMTQGWAAGVTLLLAEQDATSRTAARSLAGDAPHAVFDYFAAEIFSRLDPATRQSLLATAFLPSVSVASARALAGTAEVEEVLARLHRRRYFTERLAGAERVYRYHPLFREFLQSYARNNLGGERLRHLQHETAGLLESAGEIDEAASLYRETAAWDALAGLIVRHAETLYREGRIQTLQTWLSALPSEAFEAQPWLLYWRAYCHMPFDPAASQRDVEAAYKRFGTLADARGLYLAWVGVVDAVFYEFDSFTKLDRWIAEFDRLRALYPDFPSADIEARVTSAIFSALTWRQPSHPQLTAWAQRVEALVVVLPAAPLRMQLASNLLLYHNWLGDFRKAGAIVATLKPARAADGEDPLTRQIWCHFEAMHAWLTRQAEACLAAVETGLALAAETGVGLVSPQTYWHGIAARLILHDVAGAEAYLARLAEHMADHTSARRVDRAFFHTAAAMVATARGDLRRAAVLGEQAVRLARDVGVPVALTVMGIDYVATLFETGNRREALDLHAELWELIRGLSQIDWIYTMHAAYFALAEGRRDEARNLLREALPRAARHGYVYPFRMPLAALSRLCGFALEAGIESDLVRGLIRKLGLTPPEPLAAGPDWPWPLKVYTLGRYSVLKDDAPIEQTAHSARKPLELLAALIALGGRGVGQERITEALWPDADGDAAHRAFDTTLHRLRKLLGNDELLALKDGRLTLDARSAWVDCWSLERLLTQVEKMSGAKGADTEQVGSLEKEILGLYHGPFLGDNSTQPWALSLRERLRSRFLRALSTLGAFWENRGVCDKAIALYLRGLEVDPLAEVFYRNLMQCYIRLRRPAEACAAYERCHHALTTILKVAPSSETEALRRSINPG